MSKSTDRTISQALFQTEALRVSPPDHPFWYTSGLLGPYYVNTHFLYGSEEAAKSLLSDIETHAADNRDRFTNRILMLLRKQVEENDVFRFVTQQLVDAASDWSFDVVSGGERRDYFFSVLLADLTGKPHLTLFKDGDMRLSSGPDLMNARKPGTPDSELQGKTVLHVADLVTQASSYVRAWLPAIRSTGAGISRTLVVVDRDQGGRAVLDAEHVDLTSLILLDDAMFVQARDAGILSDAQLDLIRSYHTGPEAFMTSFLSAHPCFLDQEIAAGGRAKERALRCMELGYTSGTDPES